MQNSRIPKNHQTTLGSHCIDISIICISLHPLIFVSWWQARSTCWDLRYTLITFLLSVLFTPMSFLEMILILIKDTMNNIPWSLYLGPLYSFPPSPLEIIPTFSILDQILLMPRKDKNICLDGYGGTQICCTHISRVCLISSPWYVHCWPIYRRHLITFYWNFTQSIIDCRFYFAHYQYPIYRWYIDQYLQFFCPWC